MTTYNGVSLIRIVMNLQSKMESGYRKAAKESKWNFIYLNGETKTTYYRLYLKFKD